jgi:ribosomal protein S14
MRKQKIKDIAVRTSYKKTELHKIELNLIYRLKEKNVLFRLEKSQPFIFHTKIVNRCIISNRKKCIHRKFRISRIMLRNSIVNGLVLGVKKASF